MPRKANLPSRSHRPPFPRPLPSRCGVPRFAAPAAYGFPRRRGFSTFRWAEGSETDPEPVGMLETPAGQSPRFRQVEGFSALSMAGGFLDRPAGCWKGGKAAPSPRFRNAPAPSRRPQRLPKSQRKRAPSRMPFTRLSNPRNIRQPMPDIQRLRPQTRDSRSHLLRRP